MKLERFLDDLSKALAQPRGDWCRTVGAIAVDLAGKLATGLAIGLGIAAGYALAG